MRVPVATIGVERQRPAILDPRRNRRTPGAVGERYNRRAPHGLKQRGADVALHFSGFFHPARRLSRIDAGQHLAHALEAQVGVSVQHEAAEGILGVRGLTLLHAVAFAAQVLAQVARAPTLHVLARLDELRRDRTHPGLVARVAIVLAHRPQRGAGFQHVAAEVLHEAVFVLLVQKVGERAARLFMPTHRVHELNDGRTFRADGRVDADGGRKRAVRFEPVVDQIQVQQPGANHLVEACFRHAHLRRGFQLFQPIGAAFGVARVEALLAQTQRAFHWNGPMRNRYFERGGLTGLQKDRQLARPHGRAVQLRGEIHPAARKRAETVRRIEAPHTFRLPLREGVAEESVARHRGCVHRAHAQVEHSLFGLLEFTRAQTVEFGLLRSREHVSGAVAVGHQIVRAAHGAGRKRRRLQADKGGVGVGDLVVAQLAVQDRQHTVFQAAHDVIRRSPTAPGQKSKGHWR